MKLNYTFTPGMYLEYYFRIGDVWGLFSQKVIGEQLGGSTDKWQNGLNVC